MAEAVGLKSRFQRYTGTTFEDVAQVASITPPQPSREVVEVDDLNPPDDIKKKLPGIIDAGEVTLRLNFDPDNTGHTTLEQDFYAGTITQYRIVLPSNDGWTFSGFISGWAPQELAEGDVIQVEVTFTVTSKPEFGPVTP